jgi:Protein of unknown function (DUF3592)
VRRLLGVLLVLAGGALLTLGIAVGVDAVAFVRGSSESDGEIRSIRENDWGDLDNLVDGLYTVSVLYASEEDPHVADAGVHGLPFADPPYRRGDRVDVRYDPDRPDDARVATVAGLWLLPTLEAALGLLVALLGLGLVRRNA